MRILVTNDDGVRAPGLAALVQTAQQFGQVKIVAPDHERSACGHSMTMRDPLRVKKVNWAGVCSIHDDVGIDLTPNKSIDAYEVNGVPVDCVNVGLTVAWPDGCDLVLSGINNGPNLGFDITYSGTCAGAMEGAINGIRSIAISMAAFVDNAPYHYEAGKKWLDENLRMLLELENKPLTFLNVNVPAIDFAEIEGYRFCSMGKRVYEDRVEMRSDPWGRPYYWQGGVVVMRTDDPMTDVNAVSEGYVSVTPISLDWTDYDQLRVLNAGK